MARPGPTVRERDDGVTLRALRLEVVEGPDKGKSVTSTGERVTVGSSDANDLVLRDPTVSKLHLSLVRSGDRVEVVDHASTNGTKVEDALLDGGKVLVRPGSVLRAGRTRIAVHDGDTITVPLHPEERLGGLIGRAPAMRALMARVAKVAASDASVLLEGESGTGKEVIAHSIHELSARRTGPFVTLDCAALAPSLLASELFGHEKGAFTGADRRFAGALERASGGTVFLDELGELPGDQQAALLGALERRRFRRVGGSEEIAVDVRLIAATNRDLQSEVNRGTFRLDLYYRLAVVSLRIPPLRERPEDVPLLIEHFAKELGQEARVESVLPRSSWRALAMRPWPGNVRELRNTVEAALALGEIPSVASTAPAPGSDPIDALLGVPYHEARQRLTDEFERRWLTDLLSRSEGNVAAAARLGGLNRAHLFDLIKKHRLKPRG